MVKLKKLVDTEEAMEKFIADYRIPPNVSLRHCKVGEWHDGLPCPMVEGEPGGV